MQTCRDEFVLLQVHATAIDLGESLNEGSLLTWLDMNQRKETASHGTEVCFRNSFGTQQGALGFGKPSISSSSAPQCATMYDPFDPSQIPQIPSVLYSYAMVNMPHLAKFPKVSGSHKRTASLPLPIFHAQGNMLSKSFPSLSINVYNMSRSERGPTNICDHSDNYTHPAPHHMWMWELKKLLASANHLWDRSHSWG